MKQIIIFFISVYQLLLSPIFHHFGVGGCRYPLSCSSYAKQVIAKYGMLKGGLLALKRLSTCHPFAKATSY